MAVRNTFFHQDIADYGPLQSSQQGDHKEIAGYGPHQSSDTPMKGHDLIM